MRGAGYVHAGGGIVSRSTRRDGEKVADDGTNFYKALLCDRSLASHLSRFEPVSGGHRREDRSLGKGCGVKRIASGWRSGFFTGWCLLGLVFLRFFSFFTLTVVAFAHNHLLFLNGCTCCELKIQGPTLFVQTGPLIFSYRRLVWPGWPFVFVGSRWLFWRPAAIYASDCL